MPKGKTRPEYFLAFHMGLKPNDLISRGCIKWSVYNYYRRYNQIVGPAFIELMNRPINNDSNSKLVKEGNE